jgi:hypothetical protein
LRITAGYHRRFQDGGVMDQAVDGGAAVMLCLGRWRPQSLKRLVTGDFVKGSALHKPGRLSSKSTLVSA